MPDTTVTVRLPKPHPMQLEIKRSNAKRVVCCAGRRAGKTTLAAAVAVEKMIAGRRVLLASTTQEQADAFWDKCKTWLADAILAGMFEKNEQRRILTMPHSGGRIKVKTASDADTLRGDYADFLVLDECALLAPDAWEKVGAPMLLDNDGDAWFISTPRRRNWFHTLYQKAVADGERWQAWHFSSYDNPYLSQTALAELTTDMTEEDIDQEIKAIFLEGEGQVFRNITANLTAPLYATPMDHAGHSFVAGVDWGQRQDFTAISVVCVDCRCEVQLDRFNKIAWDFQRGRLRTAYDLWGIERMVAESNSIGSPNIEALQDEGMTVQPFETTATSKPPLIKSLALALERNEVRWLDVPAATAELNAYESKANANTGRLSYSAPDGMHDDTVIARALALYAVEHADILIGFV